MGIVVTYVAYLLISITLTVLVGSALSRSGRIFLLDVFGGQVAPAQAASRLIVVGFYLLNLGFIVLTMRMSGEIGGAREVIQALSVKIGEVLLVLGVLYLANIGFLTRLRRRGPARPPEPVPGASLPPAPDYGRPERGGPERGGPETAGPSRAATAQAQPDPGAPASAQAQGLWRPRPRQALD